MAMVNMNNLLNGKDSRWLQLEVCREFQRNKCSRPDTECKFAHPPANVEVQNGRVTACYDSIKGRCNRDKPPCKYFHPPQHLKDQLLINGRNHLALKNALMQQMGLTPGQPLVPGQVPAVVGGKFQIPTPALTFGQPHLGLMATNPYLAGMPQVGSTFSPYFSPGPIMMGPDPSAQLGMVQQTVVTQQKMPRSDRLEPSVVGLAAAEMPRKRPRDPSDDLLLMDMKSVGSFYYENFAFPGMMPYKRAAGDKSGVPVYQPSATYQQLLQPFVPVSCEYRAPAPPAAPVTTSLAAYTGMPLNKQTVPQNAPPSNYQLLTQHFAALAAAANAGRPPAPPPAASQYPGTSAATHSHSHTHSLPNPLAPQTNPSLITDLLAAVNNNNDDELQPYKKMKTT